MPRRQILLRAGYAYHVFNRGHNRERIFFERENYLFFLRRMREYLSTDIVTVIAYCLMPNHYHLLVTLNTDDFAETMGILTMSCAKAINERYKRVGTLFQGRFRAVLVDRDEYLLHLSRYIHLNPEAAGLVAQAQDWEFSSYRDYVGLREGSLPNPGIVLEQFTCKTPRVLATPSQAYQQFVQAYQLQDKRIIEHLALD